MTQCFHQSLRHFYLLPSCLPIDRNLLNAFSS
ncbi:DUF1435 family protein [Virgibacillus halotolerans]